MLGYIQYTSWPRCRFPAFICTHNPTIRQRAGSSVGHGGIRWRMVAYGGMHPTNTCSKTSSTIHPGRTVPADVCMYMMVPSYHEARTTRGLGLAYPAIVRRRGLFSPRVYLAELSNRPPNCWIGCVSVRLLCDEHANDVLSRLLLHCTVSYVHTWYTYIACSPPV